MSELLRFLRELLELLPKGCRAPVIVLGVLGLGALVGFWFGGNQARSWCEGEIRALRAELDTMEQREETMKTRLADCQGQFRRSLPFREYTAAQLHSEGVRLAREIHEFLRKPAQRDRLSTYTRQFKQRTIDLRKEILGRLDNADSTYEYPQDEIGMAEVADDLERLAKTLPLPPREKSIK